MRNVPPPENKQPYRAPRLRVYGNVRTLTRGGSDTGVDGGVNIPGVSTKMTLAK